jgi:hypothetical protein
VRGRGRGDLPGKVEGSRAATARVDSLRHTAMPSDAKQESTLGELRTAQGRDELDAIHEKKTKTSQGNEAEGSRRPDRSLIRRVLAILVPGKAAGPRAGCWR